jgi:hypothetical protein
VSGSRESTQRSNESYIYNTHRFSKEENVIRWLLENPNFVLNNTQDSRGNTALHTAIGLKLPHRLKFHSENFHGNLGEEYVARASLFTLLGNSDFSKAAINVPK